MIELSSIHLHDAANPVRQVRLAYVFGDVVRIMSASQGGQSVTSHLPSGWVDVRRNEALVGEARTNLVRLAAIVVFYGQHLVDTFLRAGNAIEDRRYQAQVMGLVLAWSAAAMLIHLRIYWQRVPNWLKYAATMADLVLLTTLLIIVEDPKSMLATIYFLVIATSALRLSVPMVYTATLASMLSYLVFLGYLKFGLRLPDSMRLSRSNQIVFELALVTAGVITGQVVRQSRRLVMGLVASPLDSTEESA